MKDVTVADLIAQLSLLPKNLTVHTQGCDCEGEASGAFLCEEQWSRKVKRKYVLIGRTGRKIDQLYEKPLGGDK
jgi:hypothetical protein